MSSLTSKALEERGEALAQIGSHFASIQESAKTALDSIKDYNAKQAKKKWWQF